MRRAAIGWSVMMTGCLVAGMVAQTTPNLSGTWTLVPDPNAPQAAGRGRGGGMFGGLGTTATIAQDAKTLTITRTTQAGEVKSVYNLDGSDSPNTMTFGENSIQLVSKAKWDAGKLSITTSSNFNGNAFETTMRLSLEGGNLVVESTRPDFQGGGAPVTTKMTYKKV
jgi:hypothetical protein